MGSRFLGTRPTVDSDSDTDDERLPVGAVPQDVMEALEPDLLCTESFVGVDDAEVFATTHDAESDYGRTRQWWPRVRVGQPTKFLLVCRVHPRSRYSP